MIDVPKANPILFRPLTGQTDTNFDNLMEDDYKGENRLVRPFAQYIDEDYIQAVSDTDYYDENTVTCDLVLYAIQGTTVEYADFMNQYYNAAEGLYYYVWKLQPFTVRGCMKLRIGIFSTGVDRFESEWVHIDSAGLTALRASNQNIMKLEWYNHENAMGMDYTMSGFVGCAYIEAKMTYAASGGDVTVFDNQGTSLKLKETVQRVFKFDADVPAYLAEQIAIWMAHDRFYINDVEYVSEKKPALQQIGNSNIFRLEAELTQAAVIGMNTHDVGFTVDTTDTVIMNITESGKVASFTVAIPAGYLLHIVTITRTAGSGTVAAGTTVGGTDIFTAQTVDGTTPTVTVQCHDDFAAATTLYLTLTGTVTVTVNFQLLKATE